MGEYPGSNREHTVPQTVDLPIELYPPYVGVIRTLNCKYQKFMTYPLVHNIESFTLFKKYINNRNHGFQV